MRYLRVGTGAVAIAVSLAMNAAQAQDVGAQDAAAVDDQGETQSGQPVTAGEIVVTAQKTGAQSLQEVPLAIQAFDGEELKERNITTIGDLVSSVPGAQEGFRQSNASRFYNLRGNVTQNGDSPIGYYLDETPFIVTNFGIAPPVRFIDIDRV